jgi:hypothetical protein
MRKRRFHAPLVFLGYFAILALVGFVAFFFFFLPWHTLELSRSGVSTQGIVSSASPCDAGLNGSYRAGWILRITYTDVAGHVHTFSPLCGNFTVATIGSTIAVRYLPTNPDTADLEVNVTSEVGSSIASIVFGCLLLGGGLLLVSARIADYFVRYKFRRAKAKRSPSS